MRRGHGPDHAGLELVDGVGPNRAPLTTGGPPGHDGDTCRPPPFAQRAMRGPVRILRQESPDLAQYSSPPGQSRQPLLGNYETGASAAHPPAHRQTCRGEQLPQPAGKGERRYGPYHHAQPAASYIQPKLRSTASTASWASWPANCGRAGIALVPPGGCSSRSRVRGRSEGRCPSLRYATG